MQVSEDLAAKIDEYFPASQSVQLDDAEELKDPASQAKQVSDDAAPVAELYRPATQSVHVSEDSAAKVEEYLPASHSRQAVDDPSEYFPASQFTQSELKEPPLGL